MHAYEVGSFAWLSHDTQRIARVGTPEGLVSGDPDVTVSFTGLSFTDRRHRTEPLRVFAGDQGDQELARANQQASARALLYGSGTSRL